MTARTAALAAVTLALVSCSKADGGGIPTAPTSAPAAAKDVAPSVVPKVEGPVGVLLERYEAMRAALAADNVATALTAAQPLADASKEASAAAGPHQAQWTAVAALAGQLATDKPDLKATRLKFADISKAVVTVLVADPKLREGRFIFECPMAPAYQRWVQTSAALRNPYWGSEMLECGSQVDWRV